MREIKYKAYVKGLNLVLPVLSIQFDFKKVEVPATYSKHIDTEYFNFEQVELMQYTGLKDVKGNEIYEGDILKVPEYYEHQENQTMTYFNWEVTYENCAFRLDGISMEEDYEWISTECEVIGNKFESPELLQGGK